MKKLRLEIDTLKVQTFDAGKAPRHIGTVHGAAYTPACDSLRICAPTQVGSEPNATCDVACTGTCGNTYGDCCGASGYFTCNYCY
jgi:hypothetical protein